MTMALAMLLGFGISVPDANAFIAGDGKGKAERDCYIGLEGYGDSDLSPINKKGTKFGIACTDCDPACDLDGVDTANGTCTFSIAACVNQAGVAGCDPATRETKKTSAKAKSKAGKLDLGSTLPADGSSACSSFVDFPVPTKKNGKKAGKGKVTLKATKKTDKDVFRFVCHPRPEGEACSVPTTTSSTVTTTTVSSTTTTTTPLCAGAPVGGACWFLGALSESCDTVCGNQALVYDNTTATFAGDDASGGTNSNCEAVLTALSAPGDGPPVTSGGPCFGDTDGGHGCEVSAATWFRCSSPATTSTARFSSNRRACACM